MRHPSFGMSLVSNQLARERNWVLFQLIAPGARTLVTRADLLVIQGEQFIESLYLAVSETRFEWAPRLQSIYKYLRILEGA